ncbi:MAG: YlxR family protein [Actinomycetota bacterium]
MAARGNGREPQRTCVACRQVRPKSELIRLVVSDGDVVVDERKCAPGRGAYVCADGDCASRARGVAKALRMETGAR